MKALPKHQIPLALAMVAIGFRFAFDMAGLFSTQSAAPQRPYRPKAESPKKSLAAFDAPGPDYEILDSRVLLRPYLHLKRRRPMGWIRRGIEVEGPVDEPKQHWPFEDWTVDLSGFQNSRELLLAVEVLPGLTPIEMGLRQGGVSRTLALDPGGLETKGPPSKMLFFDLTDYLQAGSQLTLGAIQGRNPTHRIRGAYLLGDRRAGAGMAEVWIRHLQTQQVLLEYRVLPSGDGEGQTSALARRAKEGSLDHQDLKEYTSAIRFAIHEARRALLRRRIHKTAREEWTTLILAIQLSKLQGFFVDRLITQADSWLELTGAPRALTHTWRTWTYAKDLKPSTSPRRRFVRQGVQKLAEKVGGLDAALAHFWIDLDLYVLAGIPVAQTPNFDLAKALVETPLPSLETQLPFFRRYQCLHRFLTLLTRVQTPGETFQSLPPPARQKLLLGWRDEIAADPPSFERDRYLGWIEVLAQE